VEISWGPSSSATRFGNTGDFVQPSLRSPDVGVCSPFIRLKFVTVYLYYYYQYDFIPRRILFPVLPGFQYANAKSGWPSLCSNCHSCWLVRLDLLGKAKGRAPDPTLCRRRRKCGSRQHRLQEFVELSARKAHEPSKRPKSPGRGLWCRNDEGLNITTIMRWPMNCTICYDRLRLYQLVEGAFHRNLDMWTCILSAVIYFNHFHLLSMFFYNSYKPCSM